MELSGSGATPGTNFNNGVKLAVKEINASGGILGRPIDYQPVDTQTNPGVAKALAQKAIDDGAYVVLGPVHSGSMLVTMSETQRAAVTNFTGGEAASITQQGDPYVFRSSFTQLTSMPKVSRYIRDSVKAKTVAVMFTNNDYGKGGHDAMLKALAADGIKVLVDVPTEPLQVDFLGRGVEGQAIRCRCPLSLHARGGVGAGTARASQARLCEADHRRDHGGQPEDDRARG